MRHQCVIYELAPSNYLKGIAHVIIEKLKENYRCLYLNSKPMVASMRSCLAALDLDVAGETAKGALLLSSEQRLQDGKFNPDAMIDVLRNAVQQALADGYMGLWTTGDMTWEIGGDANLHLLLEYESKLEAFMKENPNLMGICQYHRDTMPPLAILTALRTHKALSINETLARLNPHYRCSSIGPWNQDKPRPKEIERMMQELSAAD